MASESHKRPFGTTSLVYGKRVPKTHPRVQACGSVDELNSTLGLCRAHTSDPWEKEHILAIQKNLIAIMSELGTEGSDQERFFKESPNIFTEKRLNKIIKDINQFDKKLEPQRHWMYPGESIPAAFYDQARTACRRTERLLWMLKEDGLTVRSLLLDYLNRLSKFLWMLERKQTDEGFKNIE